MIQATVQERERGGVGGGVEMTIHASQIIFFQALHSQTVTGNNANMLFPGFCEKQSLSKCVDAS